MVPALPTPVLFCLGLARNQRGLLRRAERAREEAVWFEHSGHERFVDEPEAFNATMTDLLSSPPHLVTASTAEIAEAIAMYSGPVGSRPPPPTGGGGTV